MATKTNLAEETKELNEQEAEEFFQKLDEFKEKLSEKEQFLLASMVVEAGEEQTEGKGEPSEVGVDESKLMSEDEHKEFARKLNEFHDSLPDNLHHYLDSLVGQTALQEDQDVQGYGGWLFVRWIPRSQIWAYKQVCYRYGGDYWRVTPYRRFARGTEYRLVGCYDYDA